MRELVIIAAAAENNALGIDNDLPWHMPHDFARFKRLTSGHKMIMGRRTLDSFPEPLPNREHIAITRNADYKPAFDSVIKNNLEDAIKLVGKDEKAFIIGGGQIYAQSMDLADTIELTRIHASFEADTFFPEIDGSKWRLVKKEVYKKDNKNPHDFTYLTYKRK